MGIPGLYDQIGAGERASLVRLAADHFKLHRRKYRIAVDASIWLFQVKAGQGGSNPELRTLYFRLLRLLQLGIDPVFVFDGKGRPSEKRNKKISGSWESLRAKQARELLTLFGFVHHQAPGEAEAECALLQQRGLVDAVFSEDGDTLAFGATTLLRNWSSQERRGSKVPTHVNVYQSTDIISKTGLDREAMILVALMSGGDYDTEGINRCGHKIAYEAAKAGFGNRLCALQPSDDSGLVNWREELQQELIANKSKVFSRKHPSIVIKPNFPRRLIIDNYMNPLVSAKDVLDDLGCKLAASRTPDLPNLRAYVAEKLDWSTVTGAKKFIRGMAPAILTHRLISQLNEVDGPKGLREICGCRTHFTGDGIPEFRVMIMPIELVPLNLERESVERATSPDEMATLSDGNGTDMDGAEVRNEAGKRGRSSSPSKYRMTSTYNPAQLEKIYLPECYVKHGAPVKAALWDEQMAKPKVAELKAGRSRGSRLRGGMAQGAIERYVVVTKSSFLQSSARANHYPKQKDVYLETHFENVSTSIDKPVSQLSVQNTTRESKAELADGLISKEKAELFASVTATPPLAFQSTSDEVSMPQHPPALETSRLGKGKLLSRVGNANDTKGEVISAVRNQQLIQYKPGDSEADSEMLSISSQDLLDAETLPLSRARRFGNEAMKSIRIRDSLDGSWAMHSSPTIPRREQSVLSNVEFIDMT